MSVKPRRGRLQLVQGAGWIRSSGAAGRSARGGQGGERQQHRSGRQRDGAVAADARHGGAQPVMWPGRAPSASASSTPARKRGPARAAATELSSGRSQVSGTSPASARGRAAIRAYGIIFATPAPCPIFAGAYTPSTPHSRIHKSRPGSAPAARGPELRAAGSARDTSPDSADCAARDSPIAGYAGRAVDPATPPLLRPPRAPAWRPRPVRITASGEGGARRPMKPP